MERITIQVALTQFDRDTSVEEEMSGAAPKVQKTLSFMESGEKIATKIPPILAEIAKFAGVVAN